MHAISETLTLAEAKSMAKALRSSLEGQGLALSHAQALETIAAQLGARDWNTLSARLDGAAEQIRFTETCPVLRIFDEGLAKEYYLGFLGFSSDWEHRFGDNFPLYTQVSRAGLILHLSGHHGDATPGAAVFVRMRGVRAFQQELAEKNFKHNRPGLQEEPWGLVTSVTDPFNNRIHFCEPPAA